MALLLSSAPVNLRVSSKRTSSMIKIRWDPPEMNISTIKCYEMQIRTKKGEYETCTTTCDSQKCSGTVRNLKQNTKYYFRVRAVTSMGRKYSFSEEIKAKTKMHKAAKGALLPLAFIGGTIAGPFVGGIGGATLGGVAAVDSANTKVGKGAAGVAGGAAGMVGGGILGTLGAPLIGGACAYAMYHDSDWSDQSSDEEEPQTTKETVKETKPDTDNVKYI